MVRSLDLIRTPAGDFALLVGHDNIGVGEKKRGHIPYWRLPRDAVQKPKQYALQPSQHLDHVRQAAFSPDRQSIAAAGIGPAGRTVVVVWKVSGGLWQEEKPLGFGPTPPRGLVWQDNNTWILATEGGLYAGEKNVFSAGPSSTIQQVASAPAKRLLAFSVAHNDLSCNIHRRRLGQPFGEPLRTPFLGDLTALALSPDGRWLAAAGLAPIGPQAEAGQAILIWDFNTGRQVCQIPDQQNAGAVGGPIGNLAVIPGRVKKGRHGREDFIAPDRIAFAWGPWIEQAKRKEISPLRRVFIPGVDQLPTLTSDALPDDFPHHFPDNTSMFFRHPQTRATYIGPVGTLANRTKGVGVFGPLSPTPGIQADAKSYAYVRFTHQESGRALLAIGYTRGIIIWDANEFFQGLGARKMRDEGLSGNNARAEPLDTFFKKAILRRFWGHVGDTTVLAASPRGDYLVSGGKDGAIRAWSLNGIGEPGMKSNRFGLKNEFGLRVVHAQTHGVLRVVADPPPTSPAAEAGFKQGDEILALEFAGRKLNADQLFQFLDDANVDTNTDDANANNSAAQTLFLNPTPGGDAFFSVRDDQGEKILQSRNTRDPIWVLYPQFDGNWSLTTPPGYYDTSTAELGRYQWLVNLDAAESFDASAFKPQVEVFPEHLFATTYRREEMVNDAVEYQQQLPPLRNAIPPSFRFDRLGIPEIGPIKVRVRATPNDTSRIEAVTLFVNGFRLQQQRTGNVAAAVVPRDALRTGENEMVATSIMSDGKQFSDVKRLGRFSRPQNGPRKIHFLGVGVEQIHHHPEMKLNYSADDVQRLAEVLRKSCPNLGNVVVLTDDQSPTKNRIVQTLDRFTNECGPDDLAVIMFSGHGLVDQRTGQYVYLPADAKRGELLKTGVTARLLQDKFSQLRCRSVVLLDTCRSRAADAAGQTDSFPGRSFGPILLSACRGDQEAAEGQGHGAFTMAILEALDGQRRFQGGGELPTVERDANADGVVSLAELMEYVVRLTPAIKNILKEGGTDQNPNLLPSVTFRDADQIIMSAANNTTNQRGATPLKRRMP